MTVESAASMVRVTPAGGVALCGVTLVMRLSVMSMSTSCLFVGAGALPEARGVDEELLLGLSGSEGEGDGDGCDGSGGCDR